MSRPAVLVLARQARGLKGIQRSLGLAGCSWNVVTDRPTALQALEAEPPDLVLVELGFLRHEGPDLLRSLKEADRCPVVLLSDASLARQDVVGPPPRADGVLAVQGGPALLRDLLAPLDLEPEGRLRTLAALGEITRNLGTRPDRRAVQERVLDLVHRELGSPCAFLGVVPSGPPGGLGACCVRGLSGDAAARLHLALEDPRLAPEESEVVVEADPRGADLEAWCARHGYARAALAPVPCRGRFKGAMVVLAEGTRRFRPDELELFSAVAG